MLLGKHCFPSTTFRETNVAAFSRQLVAFQFQHVHTQIHINVDDGKRFTVVGISSNMTSATSVLVYSSSAPTSSHSQSALSSLHLKMATPSQLPTSCPEPKASTLELIFLSIAIVGSAIINLLSSSRRRQSRLKPTSRLDISLSIGTACGAILLSGAVLILGWLHIISIGILTAVIFALVPPVLTMPADLLKFWYYSFYMRKYFDIDPMSPSFDYIRFGKKCKKHANCEKWAGEFLLAGGQSACKGPECVAQTYIREVSYTSAFPPHFFDRISQCLKRRARKSRPTTLPISILIEEGLKPDRKVVQHWHGIRVRHSQHCIVLRDVSKSLNGWWFAAVASATWLVAEPELVKLTSPARMCHALQAVLDILSIGDVILARRRGYIWDELKHSHNIHLACAGTSAFIYNSLIEKL